MENGWACFAVAMVVLVVPVGIAAIWAAMQVSRLTRHMAEMQKYLEDLAAQVRQGGGAGARKEETKEKEETQTLAPTPAELQSAAPGTAEIPVVGPAMQAAEIIPDTKEETTTGQGRAPSLQTAVAETATPSPYLLPSRERGEETATTNKSGGVELFLGRQILAWAGMLVLLVAAVLFLKYAFEHHMLSPMGKVLILSGLGVVVLCLGEWFNHKKWVPLARTMSGGGIGLLLFAAFAAMALFDLIGWQACLGWMAAVVGLAILLAVRYDSLTIAIISTLAGVAVPLMLWRRDLDFNLVFLFLAGVDAGVMVLAVWRRWRVVNLIALAGTVLVVLLWLGDKHHFQVAAAGQAGVEPWMAAKVLGGFFLLFLAVSVVYHAWRREEAPLDLPLLLGNPVWAYATTYGLFNRDYHNWMAPVALAGFAVYVLVAVVLWRRVKEPRSVVIASAAVAIGFLTAAVPIHYAGLKIPLVLAAEAGLLYAIAAGFRKPWYRVAGFVVYALTAVALLWNMSALVGSGYAFFWNERCLTLGVVIASLTATALVVRCGAVLPWPACSPSCAAIPALLAHAVVLFLLTVEARTIMAHLPWWSEPAHEGSCYLVYTIGYLIYAMAMLAAGVGLRQSYLRVAATALAAVSVMKLLSFDASGSYAIQSHPIINLRFAAFAGAIVWLVLANRLARVRLAEDKFFGGAGAPAVLALAAHVLVLVLFTLETATFFSRYENLAAGHLGRQMVYSIFYAAYAAGLLAAGFVWRRTYLRVAALVLFAVTLGKVFFYDLRELEALYRIASFAGLAVLLLVGAWLYNKYQGRVGTEK